MKTKKNFTMFIAGFVCAAAVFSGIPSFASSIFKTIEVAYQDIKIYMDGNLIQSKDATGAVVEPFIYNGTTYLPVRAIGNAFGKSVEWDGRTNSIYLGEYSPEIVEVTVSTAEEFVNALGSNKKILLNEGIYNLSDVTQEYSSNPQVYWQEVHDGNELSLYGVHNLTIQGVGDNPSEIIIEPRYAYVLNFISCSGINISNIKAGHTEEGYCLGGVFAFSESSDIQIDNSHMYGCGTEGLRLEDVSNMSVRNSSIYECTYYIMSVNGCENILFDNTLFRDNGIFSLVNIRNTKGFSIENSEFKNNTARSTWGNDVMFSVSLSEDVCIKNTKFIDNDVEDLGSIDAIIFESNTFTGNGFEVRLGE